MANNDTGLTDAAGGLALIPFFLAAGLIFVIGVAIAFIWVPIVLIVLWAVGRAFWNLGILQVLARATASFVTMGAAAAWSTIRALPEIPRRRRMAVEAQLRRRALERAAVEFYEQAGIADPFAKS